MVSGLLSRKTKEWNKALAERLLLELTNHIFSIRPSTAGTVDSYIWSQQQSGSYSIKSGYFSAQALNSQSTISLLGNDDAKWEWKKLIWTPHIHPKIKFFLWKCALNSLPTGENLRKRGVLHNTLCRRCGSEETVEHILFHCEIASEVWKLCPWATPLDLDLCSSFRSALKGSFSKINLPPTGSTANLFPWISWEIWTSRNRFSFENIATSPPDIVSKAISLLKEWEAAQDTSPPQATRLTQTNPILISSTAVVFCKPTPSSYQEFVSSPLMAEAFAFIASLLHANSLNINLIWIRSDCKGLIQAISSKLRSVELYGVIRSSHLPFPLFSLLSSLEGLMGQQTSELRPSYVTNYPSWAKTLI